MPGIPLKLPPLAGLIWIIALWTLFYAFEDAFGQTLPRPDTRVVIDVSGSMKKTDPENLRVPAVKLLLNLAKDQSRLGVWSFGQQVNNLVPVATVTADWKKTASNAANAIHSRGLYTNIGAALDAATRGETKPDPAWERTIVLLSDGMVDISKDPAVNQKEKARILDEVVPRLRAAGFRIHTVALSDQADQEFLKALSLQTQGSFIVAKTADDLLKAFVDASDKVNLPEQIPLEGDSFTIDDSVKEFTALIFRKSDMKETRLKAPDGAEYSLAKGSRNLSWFADKKYDLITVYNPVPGRWQVIAELDPSNRVTVVSDLELEVRGLPDNLLEGERVTMNMFLSEQGRAIANPNFLELMDITFSQETDQGERFEGKLSHDDNGNPRVPEDGIYTAKLGRTLQEGMHTFTVMVDGKTFKRKKTQTMAVYRDVMDVRTEYRDENGQVMQFLVAQPRPGLINPENLDIIAQIQDPQGGKSIQTATLQADGNWKIDVPPVATLGSYTVLLKVKGISDSGETMERVQGPYTVDYTPVTALATETPATDPLASELPPVTFDPAAMEIPSLDVEELPPEDMMLEPEPVQAINDVAENAGPNMQAPAESADAEAVEEGSNWILLSSLFILGNVAIIGVGVYFYLRFLKKTDAEQTKVVTEITELKQRQKEERNKPAEAAAVATMALDLDIGGDSAPEAEDATVLRPSVAEPVAEPAKPASEKALPADASPADDAWAAPVADKPAAAPKPAPAPVERESTYINQAAPLELDDDEMVEIDDDYDDMIEEEVDNLDDLDMMLNEQEELHSDTEINNTIDQMLEQPTVFPDKKKAANDKDASRFADDEFMLDNPDTKD